MLTPRPRHFLPSLAPAPAPAKSWPRSFYSRRWWWWWTEGRRLWWWTKGRRWWWTEGRRWWWWTDGRKQGWRTIESTLFFLMLYHRIFFHLRYLGRYDMNLFIQKFLVYISLWRARCGPWGLQGPRLVFPMWWMVIIYSLRLMPSVQIPTQLKASEGKTMF